MKKTEAISILATSVRPREPKDRARYDEAVKMAIEALKCSETPKSSERTAESAQNTSSCAHENDVIFRQAAIDCVNHMRFGMEKLAFDVVTAALLELPAAQPEPHEGHWIGGDGSYICSECNGSPLDFIDTMGASFDAYVETPMNYCPNCGAKMKGE